MAIGASLVATLGLDSTKFNKGLDRSKNKAKSSTQQMVKSFQRLAAAIASIGLSFAGLAQYVSTLDQIAKTARGVGLGIEEFQKLNYVLQDFGVSAGGVRNGIIKLNQNILDFARGSGEAKDIFEALNLNAEQLLDAAPLERFQIVTDALRQIEDPALRAAAATKIFGRAGKELGSLLQATGADVAEVEEKYSTLSESQLESAEALGDAWATLKANSLSLLAEAFTPLINGLTTMVEWFAALIQKIDAAIVGLKEFFGFADESGDINLNTDGTGTAAGSGSGQNTFMENIKEALAESNEKAEKASKSVDKFADAMDKLTIDAEDASIQLAQSFKSGLSDFLKGKGSLKDVAASLVNSFTNSVIENIAGAATKSLFKSIGSSLFGSLLTFDTGGVVPGPKGSPQLAVVHSGETILPTHKDLMSGGSGTGGTVNLNVTGDLNESVLNTIYNNADRISRVLNSANNERRFA